MLMIAAIIIIVIAVAIAVIAGVREDSKKK